MCLKILWAHSNYWKQACLFKCNRRVYIWKQWWYNDNIKNKRYEKVLADLLLMQKHILKSINTIYNYSAKKPLVLIIQIKKWLKLIVPRKKIKSDNSTKKKTNNANNTNKNITNANNANKKITNANNANKKSLVIIALRKKITSDNSTNDNSDKSITTTNNKDIRRRRVNEKILIEKNTYDNNANKNNKLKQG